MKKLVHKLSGALIVAGISLIVCTAGASDCELLEFGAIVYRSLIGLGLVGIGASALKISGYRFD